MFIGMFVDIFIGIYTFHLKIPLAIEELAGELSVYFPFGETNTASSSCLCI
jgi:hypothetical protein